MTRDTAQRRLIRRLFIEGNRPLSPREVLLGAQTDLPKLGIATVYRTINAMVDEGWLVPVELPGEPPRYEQSGKAHHHHFSCRQCSQVFEVDGCGWSPTTSHLPAGFRVESHEIVLYGVCATCSTRKKSRRSAGAAVQ